MNWRWWGTTGSSTRRRRPDPSVAPLVALAEATYLRASDFVDDSAMEVAPPPYEEIEDMFAKVLADVGENVGPGLPEPEEKDLLKRRSLISTLHHAMKNPKERTSLLKRVTPDTILLGAGAVEPEQKEE